MMQRHQFDKVYSQMAEDFGTLDTYGDEAYVPIMFSIEGNALKVHRMYPQSNSRRLRDAIGLALFDVKERYTGVHAETKRFRNKDNERLEQAILMAFDPFTNDEVADAMQGYYGTSDLAPEALKAYYAMPIRCLLKLKESIDLWEKRLGSDGYFDFIEDYMGDKVTGEEMNYSVAVPLDADPYV